MKQYKVYSYTLTAAGTTKLRHGYTIEAPTLMDALNTYKRSCTFSHLIDFRLASDLEFSLESFNVETPDIALDVIDIK